MCPKLFCFSKLAIAPFHSLYICRSFLPLRLFSARLASQVDFVTAKPGSEEGDESSFLNSPQIFPDRRHKLFQLP